MILKTYSAFKMCVCSILFLKCFKNSWYKINNAIIYENFSKIYFYEIEKRMHLNYLDTEIAKSFQNVRECAAY